MSELVVQPADDEVFEWGGSTYLRLYDEAQVVPTLDDVVKTVCERHTELDFETTLVRLKQPEFSDYLTKRRKEHLVRTTASRLWAAEVGHKLTKRAMAELIRRLHDCPEKLRPQDLLMCAKVGQEMVSHVDKDVQEITGTENRTVHMEFKNTVMALSPDDALDFLSEAARRMRIEKGE